MPRPAHPYRLRTFLSLLLVATTAITMALVGGALLIYRLPQINNEAKYSVQREASDKARLLEFALSGLESQLRPAAALAQFSTPEVLSRSLQALIGQGEQFLAIYAADENGIIRSGGFSASQSARISSAIGGDLSRTPLFRAATEGRPVWSDKYLSAQSSNVVIGVAVREASWIIIGEVAPNYLRHSVSTVSGRSGEQVLVVDRTGEYIADSHNQYKPTDNLGALPIVKEALAGQLSGRLQELHDGWFFVGSARPEKLGWTFIVTRPAGMGNPEIRHSVMLIVAGFGGSFLIGLIFAPWWVRRLSMPIQRMIDRTHQFAEGNYEKTDAPNTRIVELNTFGDDLQRMADSIHEREASLARSEERLRATIENSPAVAIQWYDRNGICRYWNPASTDIYGYSSDEVVGYGLDAQLFADAQIEDFLAALRRIEASGQAVPSTEFIGHHKNGHEVIVLRSIFAIPDTLGGTQYVCLDIDITERKRTESALIDSERKLEAIFNASPAAMSVADANNEFRTITVNMAWERLFCRHRADAIGLNGREMRMWSNLADRDHFVNTLNTEGRVDDMEAKMLTGDGQALLCVISSRIIEIRGSRLQLMVTMDISERRRIENEILELNAELESRVAKRTAELSSANDELAASLDNLRRAQHELLRSEKLASLGALVAGIAHELNTPIGNAVLVASTLVDHQKQFSGQVKNGLSRSELNAFVDTVGEAGQILDRNLQRAADLVGSFKQLAVDQSSYQRREFDLRELVHEITLAMEPTVRKTQHRVLVDVAPQLRLDSYPGPLGQVLINLINNSLTHGFEGKECGTISIQAAATVPGWIELSVSDDGCGISAEHQKHIFDPFFTTRLGQGGSGLGLHIVFSLVVELLGGRVDVVSAPDAGAAFRVRIPTSAPPAKVLAGSTADG